MDISFSDTALTKLKKAAVDENIDLAHVLLRIAVVPGGCSGLTYDLGWDTTLQDDDETIQLEELKVVVDRKSRLYLDGSRLDFSDGLEGKGFHFENPNAVRNCACGESFGL